MAWRPCSQLLCGCRYRKVIYRRSIIRLVAGTALCAFFSDPMVDAISNFSTVRSTTLSTTKPSTLALT